MNGSISNAMAALALVLAAGCTSAPQQPETMRTRRRISAPTGPSAGIRRKMPTSRRRSSTVTSARPSRTRCSARATRPRPKARKPDLLIDYNAASEEKIKNKPFRIGIGVGSYGSSGGGSVGVGSSGVKEVKEGSLVIHVVDPARNTEVWRGTVTRELKEGAVEQSVVNAAVVDAFTDFPARSARP